MDSISPQMRQIKRIPSGIGFYWWGPMLRSGRNKTKIPEEVYDLEPELKVDIRFLVRETLRATIAKLKYKQFVSNAVFDSESFVGF